MKKKKPKLPPTMERVARTTPDSMNDRIRRKTIDRLDHIGNDPEKIEKRLVEIKKEWDFERCILVIGAFANSMSLTVGYFFYHRAFIVTALVGLFLLVHALHGWAPPLPILRRLGVRTAREIENERFILLLRRDGFHEVIDSSHELLEKLES